MQKATDSPSKTVRVTKVTKVVRNGAYMPLTKDGSIVVSSIHASSYVSIMEDAPEVVKKYLCVLSENQLLHWWLAPYRILCQSMPSLCENDKNDEGILYWLVFGRSLAKLANGWGMVMQVIGLVLVAAFMAFFVGLEVLVSFFGVVPSFLFGLILVGMAKNLVCKSDELKKTKIE